MFPPATIDLVKTSGAITLARWATAALLLAAIVFAYRHALRANPTTIALTFLLLIQWLAAYWGLRLAIAASVAAALCFNYYFLPPLGTFTIADTQNWVALGAFLATAVLGSNLADRLQQARAASERRGRELELLYDLGQRLLAPDNTADLLRALPFSIAAAFRCHAAALYLAEQAQVYATTLALDPPDGPPGGLLAQLQAASAAAEPLAGSSSGSVLVPLAVGTRPIGSIYLACASAAAYPRASQLPSAETLVAMGSLVALSLARAAAMEKLVHAEAAAESDRLRATLLDSVTHDLRTPLTSIKASVTSLLSQAALRADQREELLTVIDEESDRLNRLIAQAVEMAELDAGSVRLDRGSYALVPLFAELLEASQHRWPDRIVLIEGRADTSNALVDPALVAKVLLHLVENAAKYSTAGRPIVVRVEASLTEPARWVCVSVADQGPGIASSEQERIFDKFYRNAAHRYRVQGTGMGLPIARAIVEAHGGKLGVESAPGWGATFSFTLPAG